MLQVSKSMRSAAHVVGPALKARRGAVTAAGLLVIALLAAGSATVAAQVTIDPACAAQVPAEDAAALCIDTSGSAYLDCIHQRDALVAEARTHIAADTPPEMLAALNDLAAGDCGTPDSPTTGSSYRATPVPTVFPSPTPATGSDITACLSTDAIGALLGTPTRFNPNGAPQQASFAGPNGATLRIEHVLTNGASVYQDHLDIALATPDWQVAGVAGLGEQAFATNRGGDSRSLVIRVGDQAWLLHMDGVPAERGYPEMANIAKQAMSACP